MSAPTEPLSRRDRLEHYLTEYSAKWVPKGKSIVNSMDSLDIDLEDMESSVLNFLKEAKTSLNSSMALFTRQKIHATDLPANLDRIDQLQAEADPAESKVWRPDGRVEEYVRPYVIAEKQKHLLELQQMLYAQQDIVDEKQKQVKESETKMATLKRKVDAKMEEVETEVEKIEDTVEGA